MSTFLNPYTKTALIALTAALCAAPAVVHAQDRYDGYCYMRKHEARTNGAVVGAVAGGVLGGTVANTHNKGVGTVLGAAVGAAVGSNIGADSVKCYNGEYYSFERGNYAPPPPPEGYETVYYHARPDGTYYSRVEYQTSTTFNYDNGGYPPPAPAYQGYAPQPAYSDAPPPSYSDAPPPPPQPAYSDAPPPQQGYSDDGYQAVQGFRDEDGRWHRGQPRAVGWQDENGNWHEGRVVAYGWRDSDGHWHEDHSQDNGQYQGQYQGQSNGY